MAAPIFAAVAAFQVVMFRENRVAVFVKVEISQAFFCFFVFCFHASIVVLGPPQDLVPLSVALLWMLYKQTR